MMSEQTQALEVSIYLFILLFLMLMDSRPRIKSCKNKTRLYKSLFLVFKVES